MLGRLFKRRKFDPLWDHFIHSQPSDPKNDLTAAIASAPAGRIYPVKTEDSDPAATSKTIMELARWLGADVVGIVSREFAAGQARDDAEKQSYEAEPSVDGESDHPESSSQNFRAGLVCGFFTDYDPSEAKGLGGQQAVQKGAVLTHYMASYIRELGFRAAIGGVSPILIAEAAGLGRTDTEGRFVTRSKGRMLHLAEAVLTDLPLAGDAAP